jgi:hypothetical protein
VRGVIYEHGAAAQADAARALFPRADEVILMLEWALARDDGTLGVPLVPGGSQRLVVFPGSSSSARLPSVDVVFEMTARRVVIHDLDFY